MSELKIEPRDAIFRLAVRRDSLKDKVEEGGLSEAQEEEYNQKIIEIQAQIDSLKE